MRHGGTASNWAGRPMSARGRAEEPRWRSVSQDALARGHQLDEHLAGRDRCRLTARQGELRWPRGALRPPDRVKASADGELSGAGADEAEVEAVGTAGILNLRSDRDRHLQDGNGAGPPWHPAVGVGEDARVGLGPRVMPAVAVPGEDRALV